MGEQAQTSNTTAQARRTVAKLPPDFERAERDNRKLVSLRHVVPISFEEPHPMKSVLIAVAASFALGFAVSASASTGAKTGVGPTQNSCTAAGHACTSAEDCCSRMCRKDTRKCS